MVLFRCPACGTVHRAEPEAAGGTVSCRGCSAQIPVPRQSDPECALVYKAGDAEDGLPMTREEVARRLVSGDLAETDLIWDGRTWKPLGKAFGPASRPEGPTPGQPPAGAADEGELRVELRPIDGVRTVEPGPAAAAPPPGKRPQAGSARAAAPPPQRRPAEGPAPAAGQGAATPLAPAPAPGAPGTAPGPGRTHSSLYYVGQAALLVFALVAGYKYGAGPLLSQYRDTPSYVAVQNHGDEPCVARLGWRQAQEEVPPGRIGSFELWVGMPERHTLRVAPAAPGTWQPLRLQVPVRPGCVTLVNLREEGEYGVYDLREVEGKTLDTPELAALAQEIGSNQAPASAVKVSRQIRDLVAPAFKGTRKDTFFLGSVYEIDPATIPKLREREVYRRRKQEAKGGGADVTPPARGPSARPQLVFPAARVVSFVNGSGLVDPADKEKVDRSVVLPLGQIRLQTQSALRTLAVSSPHLRFTGDARVLRLQLQIPKQSLSEGGQTFQGSWEYSAECPLEGDDANRWRWGWTYRGTVETAGQRYALDLRIDMDGSESRRVNPL